MKIWKSSLAALALGTMASSPLFSMAPAADVEMGQELNYKAKPKGDGSSDAQVASQRKGPKGASGSDHQGSAKKEGPKGDVDHRVQTGSKKEGPKGAGESGFQDSTKKEGPKGYEGSGKAKPKGAGGHGKTLGWIAGLSAAALAAILVASGGDDKPNSP